MAEAIAVDVGKDLAVEASKPVYSIIAKHVKYLFCYGRTAKELDSQVKALVLTKDGIQQRVDAAKEAGDFPLPDVEKWLKDFHTIESEAKNITEEVQHVCCYMGSCWNLRLGYYLSKKAVEKMETVKTLRTDGKFPVVASRRPAPDVAERFKSEGFQMFDPTNRTMEEVMEALKKGETYMVGVYGMGGVGKTTLVKEVAKRAKNEGLFVNAVMATASQNPNVINMQAEIAEGLGLKLEVTTPVERAARISERLKELKKVLIILDDLWGRLELSKLGIPNKAECEGCKIVITTRKLGVCESMKSNRNIKANVLSDQESWDLFKMNAGEEVESPDVHELARDVAAECKGLPLALAILGSSMRDKHNAYEWKTTLEELRSAAPALIDDMEEHVYRPVQLSILSLPEEIRICFLFCCLFPEDYYINLKTLMYYLVGEGILQNPDNNLIGAESRVQYCIKKLQDASLLVECEGAEHVKMHDVVRDVARWTAETSEDYGFLVQAGIGLRSWDEEMDVKERKRISLMHNEIDVVPEQPMCPRLLTLLLGGSYHLKEELPERFFKGMTSLLVLDLNKVHLRSLPASLSCLTHLKTLILDGYRGSDISSTGELKQLEVLRLRDSDEISEFPEAMGNLIKLRVLDLSGCSGMELRSNILSRLTRLERLYMLDGFTKWQVGGGGDDTSSLAAFSELACLRRLTHLYVTVDNEECLSEELNPTHPWPMLQKFVIHLEDLQHSLRGVNDVESNNLLVITNRISNWVKGLLTREINLLRLQKLEDTEYLFSADADTIPHSVLSNLRGLEIACMPRLKSIFKGPLPLLDGSLEKLRQLTINECGALTDVFSTADVLWRMHNLEILEVDSCSDIRVVFNYDDELIMREEGDDGSSRASSSTPAAAASRPPGLVLLPNLREMRLFDLPRLTSLWDGMVPQGTLIIHPNLHVLYVVGCGSLKYIVSPALVAAHAFEQLGTLLIWKCPDLERLMMPSCWGTDCHAAAATAFSHLRDLGIVTCHSLTSLFSWRQAVQCLPQLEQLRIYGCSGMREIIGVWEEDDEEEQQPTLPIMLPKLQQLTLGYLPALSRFHGGRSAMPNSSTSTISLPSLAYFYVKECPELKELPFGLDSLPNLSKMMAEEEWLGALKLEDDSVKSRLRALSKPWD